DRPKKSPERVRPADHLRSRRIFSCYSLHVGTPTTDFSQRPLTWEIIPRIGTSRGKIPHEDRERRINMKRFVPAAIFVMMLASFGPGIAFGPQGGGPGGRVGRFSGVIRQLVFPCEAACRVTANECSEAAESTALDCVAAACPSEITAAQHACASDATTDTCR